MKKQSVVQKAYQKRNREIVRLKKTGWTLREIGDMFGLSYERVRQILQEEMLRNDA